MRYLADCSQHYRSPLSMNTSKPAIVSTQPPVDTAGRVRAELAHFATFAYLVVKAPSTILLYLNSDIS